MFKPLHKVLGIEKNPSNIVRATDAVGRCARETLNWSALTAGQQGLIEGLAKRRAGQ